MRDGQGQTVTGFRNTLASRERSRIVITPRDRRKLQAILTNVRDAALALPNTDYSALWLVSTYVTHRTLEPIVLVPAEGDLAGQEDDEEHRSPRTSQRVDRARRESW